MNIYLKRITLNNFKGIRHLDIPFEKVTNIFGMNGVGKTTVFDAFLWALFGKDSTDRSDFEIKTLDDEGKYYHELEHEVTVVLLVDNEEIAIRKTYKEKWVKKTGSTKKTFSGHENIFYWNDVPLKEVDYKSKIASFINEPQFKLLTNLAYFNTVLKWQDRRTALLQLAGGISDIEVATQLNVNEPGRFDHLIAALMAKKSVEEYRREIVSKKNKIKSESDSLPARIDEARRGLPEEVDFKAIETEIADLNASLATVEDMLMNKSKAQKQYQDQLTKLYAEKGDRQRALAELEAEAGNAVKNKKLARENHIADIKRKISFLESERAQLLKSFDEEKKKSVALSNEDISLQVEKEKVGKQWDAINAEQFVFDANSCTCPTCKQQLPNVDIAAKEEELKANFNTDKSGRLRKVTEVGRRLAGEIEEKKKETLLVLTNLENIGANGQLKAAEIKAERERLSVFEEEHTRLSADESKEIADFIAQDVHIQEMKEQIRRIDEQINTPQQDNNNTEALQRKTTLATQISSLNRQLGAKGQREAALQRIAELEKQESESGQAIADLERMEFDVQEFDRAKMDLLEERINGKFRLVKFKLFDRLINDGEKPTCIALINGVPYSDANTASKINASLDIISVFSEHYGIQAPVFIDNRESVVNIIDTDMQIVNLIVSADDKKLRVETGKTEQAELFA